MRRSAGWRLGRKTDVGRLMADLVSCDLSLGVVLKVSVSLDSALDEGSELLGERLVVVQVVNSQSRSRRLRRVSGSDTSSSGSDTVYVTSKRMRVG